MLCSWFYEHPYCTDSDISFQLLLTKPFIVSRFGLLNALNVNVNVVLVGLVV